MSAYSKEYYAQNREAILASNRRSRERDPKLRLEKAREYHHRNRDELLEKKRVARRADPAHFNDLKRKSKYGLTPEQRRMMLLQQMFCCAICNEETDLVVDHDHKTRKVRALLCNACNQALGLLKEDLERIKAMARYVIRHRAAMMKAREGWDGSRAT